MNEHFFFVRSKKECICLLIVISLVAIGSSTAGYLLGKKLKFRREFVV